MRFRCLYTKHKTQASENGISMLVYHVCHFEIKNNGKIKMANRSENGGMTVSSQRRMAASHCMPVKTVSKKQRGTVSKIVFPPTEPVFFYFLDFF